MAMTLFQLNLIYFEDADGQYYKVTISVGENGGVSTIYNVGKIKKDNMPNRKIISAIGSKADMSSNDSIFETNEFVKQDLSTKDTSPIQAHYAEVLRENNNLRQIKE